MSALETKMTTVAPPAPPRVQLPTAQTQRRYYTLHSNRNNAFTLKLNDDARTAIVGFRDVDDALIMGNMMETHYVHYKEWPNTQTPGNLVLPSGRLKELVHLFIRVWAFDDLRYECTSNFLDLISVESIGSTKSAAYSLNGDFYKFSADDDFYRNRIRELYELD